MRSWFWRGVALAWVAGVDLVLVAVVAACIWLAMDARRTYLESHDASQLVLGARYIRLKG